MFLDNKYTKLYFKIINSPNHTGYTERHHIIPKSLGGSDLAENLIEISARAHFICHYLLTKMVDKSSPYYYKTIRAFMMMRASSKNQTRYFNSRLFASVREEFSEAQSISQTGTKNSQYLTRWINNGCINKKIKIDVLDLYLEAGFKFGKIKKPKVKSPNKKIQQKKDRISKLTESIKPFFERFKNGESLREISKDYGYSHVTLRKNLVECFPEYMKSIIQGSLKR